MANYSQSYEDWHKKRETLNTLQRYAETKACLANTTECKKLNHEIITRIEKQLKIDKKCMKLEFTGSAYEGVQIGPDVEFDVMVIMDGNGLSVAESAFPGYYSLTANSGFFWGVDEKYKQFLSGEDRTMHPRQVVSTFAGTLQKAINSQGLDRTVKLRYHGPAIQMDVHREGGYSSSPLYFSVDVVPAFQNNGKMYVAKPFKDEELSSDSSHNMLWRISTSLMEKKFFDRVDTGNQCRKKVLRITKAMLQQSIELKGFTSFHFKTALMYLCEANSSNWNEGDLVLRFMDLLSILEYSLKAEELPHKFIGNINLYQQLSHQTMQDMYHRVRRIRKCEHIFRKIFTEFQMMRFEAQLQGGGGQHDEPHSSWSCPKCKEAYSEDPPTTWCVIS